MQQTSITTWFKKSPAVQKSLAATNSQTNVTAAAEVQHAPAPASTIITSTITSALSNHDTKNNHKTISPPLLPNTFLPKTPLVKNITLVPCDATNIPSFKRLNTLLLPIPYPSSFYKEILSDPLRNELTLLAIWDSAPTNQKEQQEEKGSGKGQVIAGISCRILPHPSSTPIPSTPISTTTPNQQQEQDLILYISTLSILSPFRNYGIATHLLSTLLSRALTLFPDIKAVGAHVWEENHEAREWYRKRGFKEVRREEGYYRRLKPQGAWVVRREVGVGDWLGK